jgi:hypothetical protein
VIREAVDRSVSDEGADRVARQQRAFGLAGAFSGAYALDADFESEGFEVVN